MNNKLFFSPVGIGLIVYLYYILVPALTYNIFGLIPNFDTVFVDQTFAKSISSTGLLAFLYLASIYIVGNSLSQKKIAIKIKSEKFSFLFRAIVIAVIGMSAWIIIFSLSDITRLNSVSLVSSAPFYMKVNWLVLEFSFLAYALFRPNHLVSALYILIFALLISYVFSRREPLLMIFLTEVMFLMGTSRKRHLYLLIPMGIIAMIIILALRVDLTFLDITRLVTTAEFFPFLFVMALDSQEVANYLISVSFSERTLGSTISELYFPTFQAGVPPTFVGNLIIGYYSGNLLWLACLFIFGVFLVGVCNYCVRKGTLPEISTVMAISMIFLRNGDWNVTLTYSFRIFLCLVIFRTVSQVFRSNHAS